MSRPSLRHSSQCSLEAWKLDSLQRQGLCSISISRAAVAPQPHELAQQSRHQRVMSGQAWLPRLLLPWGLTLLCPWLRRGQLARSLVVRTTMALMHLLSHRRLDPLRLLSRSKIRSRNSSGRSSSSISSALEELLCALKRLWPWGWLHASQRTPLQTCQCCEVLWDAAACVEQTKQGTSVITSNSSSQLLSLCVSLIN